MSDVPFQLRLVPIENPDQLNFIFGQSHFIKTVEDIHEAVVTSIAGAKFGLAFCEASGPALVRSTGTDAGLVALAERNALRAGRGAYLHPVLAGRLPHQRPERHQAGS